MSFSERVVLCRGRDFVDPNQFFGVAESIFVHVLRCEGIGEEQTGNIVRRLMEELRGVLGSPGVAVGDAIPPRSRKEAMTDAGRRVGRTMRGGIPDQRFRRVLSMPDIQRQMIEALNRMDEEGNSEEEALPQPTAEESTAFAAMIQRVFEDPCVRDPLDS